MKIIKKLIKKLQKQKLIKKLIKKLQKQKLKTLLKKIVPNSYKYFDEDLIDLILDELGHTVFKRKIKKKIIKIFT